MNRKPVRLALILAGLLGAAGLAAAREPQQVMIEARIVEVTTGDSMKLLSGANLVDFRLDGIQCPAPGEPGGQEALEFTRSQVSGREVKVEVNPEEKGPVWKGDILAPGGVRLVHQLLERGLANWNHLENPDPALGEKEVQARSQRRGMWGEVPMLADIPVLRQMFAKNDPGRVDALADLILHLPPGDRARLNARIGGTGGGLYAPGTTTIISTDRYPGQVQNGARIVERSTGRSTDLGIGIGDGGVVIRGGAAEHSRQSDTQVEVFGAPGSTLIIEDGGTHGGGSGGSGAPSGGAAVYASGGLFHRASCFGGGPTGPAMSRADALASGLSPCSKCRP